MMECPSPGPARFARAHSSSSSARSRCIPHPLGAQAVYGSIGGTVTDPSGAVLPGVTVNITSLTVRPPIRSSPTSPACS